MSGDHRKILLAATIGYVVWMLIILLGLRQSSQGIAALADPELRSCLFGMSIFYFLMFGVPIGIKTYRERHPDARSTRLEEQARARGWQYKSYENGGHRFTGTTGSVPWHIEVACHHAGKSYSDYTLWQTDAVRLSGEIVLLVSQTGKAGSIFAPYSGQPGKSQLLDMAVNELFVPYQVTSVMLLDDPEDDEEYDRVKKAFDNVQQTQAGSAALRERYFVIAHNETTARRFLEEGAERMLMELGSDKENLTRKLQVMTVVYWYKGIQFLVEGQIQDFDKLEQLVQLGVALVNGQN